MELQSFFFFLSEFYSSMNSNTPTISFCLGKTLESSTDEYERLKNEVYVFNRETGR